LRQVLEIYLKTKTSSNSDLDMLPVASLKLVLKMNLKFCLAAPLIFAWFMQKMARFTIDNTLVTQP
jgi:hypothetical protein